MGYTLPKAPWTDEDHYIESFPEFPNLDIEILEISEFTDYSEWRVSYITENPADVVDPNLAKARAYILIPNSMLFNPPYPAALCLHQCGRDCDIGKDAVVGKSVNRQDQAYGYELVKQGFTVIAPDAINCGERAIRKLRNPGDHPRTWTHSNCWPALSPYTKWGHYRFKRVLDSMKAIDVLTAYDFVDSSRIAAIGHSMGSLIAVDTMICDDRITAGILSPGGCSDKTRELIADRLLIQLQGVFDTTTQDLIEAEKNQQYLSDLSRTKNQGITLTHHFTYDCGHHFLDEFKWIAYEKLKAQMGMINLKDKINLRSMIAEIVRIINEEREDLWASFPNHEADKKIPKVNNLIPDNISLFTNVLQFQEAMEYVLIPLFEKVQNNRSIEILARCEDDFTIVDFIIKNQAVDPKVAHNYMLRESNFFLTSIGGLLEIDEKTDEIGYRVVFRMLD